MRGFINKNDAIPSAAIFLSGGGSNAEKLLENLRSSKVPAWKASALVTDAPEKSRARELSKLFDVPIVEHDIKKFYLARGESRISLFTENGRRIREEWTDELRKLLAGFRIDFGILAGFVPLSNITSDFPCLNVHPGDLTVERGGRRILAGLHTIPVEAAFLNGFKSMRSCVFVAQAYTGVGGEMDSGSVLGISEEVSIDFQGHSLESLKQLADARPEKRPPGGYGDILENIAKLNQDKLKENGDWIVFPPSVNDFAAGNFAIGEDETLYYNDAPSGFRQIKTIIYGKNNSRKALFI